MAQDRQVKSNAVAARRALAVSGAFYVLIAFEFLYMASPFAAYFYGVYGLGLDWLQGSRTTSWLIQFFLPHLVEETTSLVIDSHQTVGSILLLGGLATFAAGAVQIYSAKLGGRGKVTGGLYRHFRHPQYLGLIVASMGMLLLWPRYLVVVATVTVIFVYIALARAEERICLRRFTGYAVYLKQTGMFLPARVSPTFRLSDGNSATMRVAAWFLAYAIALSLSLLLAVGLRIHTINSFHVHTDREGVYLSIVEIPRVQLSEIARIARSAPEVREALTGRKNLIAYVLPTRMYVSEIPMNLPIGEKFGHRIPPDRDPAHHKVVFTQAVFGSKGPTEPDDILWNAVHKTALWEVHIDLGTEQITASFPPPEQPVYGDRQVPIF